MQMHPDWKSAAMNPSQFTDLDYERAVSFGEQTPLVS
jgi:hypothetical protein